MINIISIKIANNLLYTEIIHQNQYKKIIYGLEIILSTLFQIIGFIIIGTILGILDQIVFIAVGFSVLRVFAGGYHANTCFRCFILSCLMFIVGAQIAKLIQVNIFAILVTIFISAVLLKKYSPQDTKQKRLTDKQKAANRKKTLITFFLIVIISSIVYIIFPSIKVYPVLVILGLFFETLTLLPIFN